MDQTTENIRQIKKTFRLFMNGVTSRSMREKGLEYRVNWGIPLAQLKEIASGYDKSFNLASELWKDDVRECKILATMLMPADKMTHGLAEDWIKHTSSMEIAEMCALNLFQNLEDAHLLALRWLSSDNLMVRICAYHVLCRLIMKGFKPDDNQAGQILNSIHEALSGNNTALKHASVTCLTRFISISDGYSAMADSVLADLKTDIF